MLRAASLATLAVRLLLGSIAPGARHARPNASAAAARVLALWLRCSLPLQQCGAMLLQQDHCKMDTAERGRAWACFQMLMIINVIGSSRDIVVCFLDGFYNNHINIMFNRSCIAGRPARRVLRVAAPAANRQTQLVELLRMSRQRVRADEPLPGTPPALAAAAHAAIAWMPGM